MTEGESNSSFCRTTLTHKLQELDENIVNACNDLMRMKAYTPRKKVDNSNTLARLKRECERQELLIADRLRHAKVSR
eukprot:scaffold28180_cov88-Amphora_coffeaeformis.AAC.1